MIQIHGSYDFTNLAPGDYIVNFEDPAGFVPTLENVNGEADDIGADDSDPNDQWQSDPIWLDSGEDEDGRCEHRRYHYQFSRCRW